MKLSKHVGHLIAITGTFIVGVSTSGIAFAGIAQPLDSAFITQEIKPSDKSFLNATRIINKLTGIQYLKHPFSDFPSFKVHHEIATETFSYSHETIYYNHLNIPVTSSKVGLYYKITF
jgi:hypothetical protein